MKKELTKEEWVEMGKKAKAVYNANREFSWILEEMLPKKVWEEKWIASDKAQGRLRSHLDDIVCGKFKDLPNYEICTIFYGDK